MSVNLIIAVGLAILSFTSGMLGLGVAFAAIPFLGLFLPDLVHQVQPLSLLLNGVTALLSTFGFARSGFVDWKKAFPLAAITTASAPLGAFIVQFIEQKVVWIIYFAAVFYLAYQLFRPVKASVKQENFKLTAILAVPISIMSGFLGIGPGFLLLPTLILVGFEPKKAAGINAFAVYPPSFSALIPHLSTASWNLPLTILLLGGGCFIFICRSQGNQSFCAWETAEAALCHFDTGGNSIQNLHLAKVGGPCFDSDYPTSFYTYII